MKTKIKKLLLSLVLAVVSVFFLPQFFAVEAEAATYSGTCGDNLTWNLNTDTGCLKISGEGSMTYSSVPWRGYEDSIKSVELSDGLTTIAKKAFYNCNIKSILIPDSVTEIGAYAFAGCSITSIVIPDNVIIIGEYAFSAPYLSDIKIPDGVEIIGRNAFYSSEFYYNLNNWDNGVLYIGKHLVNSDSDVVAGSYSIKPGTIVVADCAFEDCNKLVDIVIPDSVISIGNNAFNRCSGLTELTIGNNVTTIGASAFYGCKLLTSLTIPDSVTAIGARAFSGCSGLTNLTIGNSVTTIGDYAFYYCSGLKDLVIPDSVITIGTNAFYYCSGLTNLTIGNSVTTIGNKAFYGCKALFVVYSAGTEEKWQEIGYNDWYYTDYPKIYFNHPQHVLVKYYTAPTCLETGMEYYLCNSCGNMIGDMEIIPETGHIYGWVVETAPTVTESGSKKQICTGCGEETGIIETILATGFEPTNGMIVDYANNIVYGFAVGIDSIDNYTDIVDDGCEWVYEPGKYGFGTGTKATLKNGDKIIGEYTIVIFGDINGDGWYDGEDAFLVNLIAKGMLDEEDVGEAIWTAADCNHDGVVDEADVDLLSGAGLKLNDVDQSKTVSELATNAGYIEYASLIDQSAGLNIQPDTDNTQKGTTTPEINETVDSDEPATENDIDIEVIFTNIFEFFKKIFALVFSFVIK